MTLRRPYGRQSLLFAAWGLVLAWFHLQEWTNVWFHLLGLEENKRVWCRSAWGREGRRERWRGRGEGSRLGLQRRFCERCSASGLTQCPFQAWVAKDSTAMGWHRASHLCPNPSLTVTLTL